MADVSITVGLTTRTCSRGHFYAVPYWIGSIGCPFCADDRLKEVSEQRDRLSSVNSRLRGVITRLKGRAS